MRTPAPASRIEKDLHAGRVGTHGDDATDDTRRAHYRSVENHPVSAAAVDGQRPKPGHAVPADHVRHQRLHRQDLTQPQKLAQALGFVGQVGALLQKRLEIANLLLEPAILRIGLAVEPVAVPQLPDRRPIAGCPCRAEGGTGG